MTVIHARKVVLVRFLNTIAGEPPDIPTYNPGPPMVRPPGGSASAGDISWFVSFTSCTNNGVSSALTTWTVELDDRSTVGVLAIFTSGVLVKATCAVPETSTAPVTGIAVLVIFTSGALVTFTFAVPETSTAPVTGNGSGLITFDSFV
jgi:hypothetical protein